MYHWSTSSSAPCYSNSGSGGGNGPLLPSMASSSYGDLLMLQEQQQQHYYSQSMQRVMSAGDLQALPGPGPGPAPVGRYSAEERRERIEKYRTKRNQRNFQKKITYACRKTLADSRPRVNGRFARNVDDDAAADQPEDPTTTTTTADVSLLNDASSSSSMPPEWWPAMQGALAVEDDELIASYLAVSSINLY
ncbi:uncharacterized protein LOC125553840 [Triticum urartu]|uniref:uncharacterized protein LOC125553840 n=1 Tax=Triticum urartu TaxID=4572 RepID=UPI00204491CD|nr:uncharacterized protein LOC125553840 [Triticum urartu]